MADELENVVEEPELTEPEIQDADMETVSDGGWEPDPPTPEQEEEWERERKAREAALLAPFKALKATIDEHDDLMADALYEITMLELGMEE